jgi:Flp pilus assembly protein protease CpaA
MVLVITISAISSFIFAVSLLIMYSYLDIRTREVPNRGMLIGGIVSLGVILQSDHLIENAILHLTAVLLTLVLGYILFRIGALGGADVKTLFTIAIISPGVEFGSWGNPVLEGILIVGLLFAIPLMIGYLKSQRKTEKTIVIPLIPIILAVYLAIQLFAIF